MKIRNKLTLAFTSVVLLSTVIIMLIANVSVKYLFEDFVVEYRTARLEQWVNIFTAYYLQEGGWEGIEDSLTPPGYRRGRTGKLPTNEHIIVADEEGRVVFDTHESLKGDLLSKATLAGGLPVMINNTRVGTVFLNPHKPQGITTLLEEEFSRSVTGAVLTGGLIAFLLALALSIYFTRKISSPVDRLIKVVTKFAGGNYNTRVQIKTNDEIEQLGNAFNAMADNIEKNEELRKSLTADVAHELRTPLAVLRGNLESLQAGVIEPDMPVISSLHDEIIRITRLVYELQELSLVEAGKLELNKVEVDTKELLHKIISSFQPDLSAKEISVELNLLENLPVVKVDRDRISQVIINLLGNALKHTPSGGNVKIEVVSKQKKLLVSVKDNGCGINEKDLPHIFERFYRSPKVSSSKDGSSGLGLAIAKGFVEAHEGTIWAENNSTGGSTFSFTLPL